MKTLTYCPQHGDRPVMRLLTLLVVTALAIGLPASAIAQSGTKATAQNTPTAGSTSKSAAPVAVSGY
jgi:hypothetical protein